MRFFGLFFDFFLTSMETTESKRFIYQFGKFALDPQEKTLYAEGAPVHLPAKEFETLLLLVENNGRALSKEEMIAAVWQDAFVEEGNLAKQISRLRKIFNGDGAIAIETLPKHGYRFTAEISRILQPEAETLLEKRTIKRLTVRVENEIDDAPLALPPAVRKTPARVLLAIFGLTILTAAGIWLWRGANAPVRINSMAVLPLKSLNQDENNKVLGLGLTDALITKIGSLRSVAVRPTSAVIKFADADALDAGRKLSVDAVLEGTIQQSEGRIRINARLLKTSDGEQLWAEKFDQPASEIFALQDALSNKITKTLAFELKKSELDTLSRRPTENAEAYEKFLRGRFYQSQNTESGLMRSIEFYRQAIALDANFAEPYVGIADANLILYNFGWRSADQTFPVAKQNLNRAFQLNSSLPDAYNSLAMIQFFGERDWGAAEKSLQKAIELDPHNAVAFLRYGYFLILLGRFDDALAKLEKAHELNPLSPIIGANTGLAYLCARRYPQAIEQFEKTVAENPDFPLSYRFLGTTYEESGDAEKAFAANLRGLEAESGAQFANRLRSVRETGGTAAANRLWLEESIKARENGNASALDIASRYALVKNREQTLDWLEKAFAEDERTLSGIKFLARYDFLRGDERFERIVRKIDFKQ